MESFPAKRLKMSRPELYEESSFTAHKISKNIEFFVSEFPTVVDTSHHVDKTLLMKDIIIDKEMVLISAPRSYGKSRNVGMLQTFVEKEMNSNRERIELQKG